MFRRVCVCAVVVGFVATAWCRDVGTNDNDCYEPTFYLGVGTRVFDRLYTDVDPKVCPVPLSAYEDMRLYLGGSFGGYRLLMWDGWSIGPIVQPRFAGLHEYDDSELDGMHERDWSIDAGLGLSWTTGFGLFGLSAVTDALGRHKGQELEFSYARQFRLGGFDFLPSAGMRWKSQNLVDYYYGVRPGEARADRPAYEGSNALDPFVRLAVRRKITPRWSLLATAQYEWLDESITDSPIVDADHDASFTIGMSYSW